jgi:hypothetical protein
MNTFYWNTADDKDHTHKRIEWAITNNYLICINIQIHDNLFNSVSKGDIILTYEPKSHKISRFNNGQDGYCCTCKQTRNDGVQAFTNAFIVSGIPIKITNTTEYNEIRYNIFRNWYTTIKHCSNYDNDYEYFSKYFKTGGKIYLFPVIYSGKLQPIISTNQKISLSEMQLTYYGKVIKGFDKFSDIYLERIILNIQHIKDTRNTILS